MLSKAHTVGIQLGQGRMNPRSQIQQFGRVARHVHGLAVAACKIRDADDHFVGRRSCHHNISAFMKTKTSQEL